MLFSSITFIYYFLPLVLLVYFICPKKVKNYVLLIASLIFYFFGEPKYIVLLLISSICDYIISLYIEKHRGERKATYALVGSLIVNLGMLGFFKYYDFFIENINGVMNSHIPVLRITLPIGISFFTFQTLSYTIDVYRGKAKAQKNLATFATFVCLFPQLVAGPIVRYTDINEELTERTHTIKRMSYGIERFVLGLSKKILIANLLGALTVTIQQSSEKSVAFYWLYAIAFTGQIYFDFSGYSDMAIGLGAMFGFTFPENFNYPYVSRSITEFWRRWHMTLSSWFRDYVYIPLGGNRTSKGKWIRNLFIVWTLTGFWHGASWNFIVWGIYFGSLLCIEKLWLNSYIEKMPKLLQHLYVLLLVIISFVIFNASDMVQVMEYLKGMFGMGTSQFMGREFIYYIKSYGVVLVIAIIGATPVPKKIVMYLKEKKKVGPLIDVLEPIFLGILLLISTAYIVDGSFNPFLYFRF